MPAAAASKSESEPAIRSPSTKPSGSPLTHRSYARSDSPSPLKSCAPCSTVAPPACRGAHHALENATILRSKQDHLPILVGVNGRAALAHAAKHADIVAPTMLGRTLPDGQHHEVTWEAARLDQTVEWIRDAAASVGRSVALHALVQGVVTGDRAREWPRKLPHAREWPCPMSWRHRFSVSAPVRRSPTTCRRANSGGGSTTTRFGASVSSNPSCVRYARLNRGRATTRNVRRRPAPGRRTCDPSCVRLLACPGKPPNRRAGRTKRRLHCSALGIPTSLPASLPSSLVSSAGVEEDRRPEQPRTRAHSPRLPRWILVETDSARRPPVRVKPQRREGWPAARSRSGNIPGLAPSECGSDSAHAVRARGTLCCAQRQVGPVPAWSDPSGSSCRGTGQGDMSARSVVL